MSNGSVEDNAAKFCWFCCYRYNQCQCSSLALRQDLEVEQPLVLTREVSLTNFYKRHRLQRSILAGSLIGIWGITLPALLGVSSILVSGFVVLCALTAYIFTVSTNDNIEDGK